MAVFTTTIDLFSRNLVRVTDTCYMFATVIVHAEYSVMLGVTAVSVISDDSF